MNEAIYPLFLVCITYLVISLHDCNDEHLIENHGFGNKYACTEISLESSEDIVVVMTVGGVNHIKAFMLHPLKYSKGFVH